MQPLNSWRVVKVHVEVLPTSGERRVIGHPQIKSHQPEQGREKAFGLAEQEVKEEAQRQAGFDGEIRVLPLPTPSTASLRLPRGNGVWGQPHGDVASLDKGPLVGRPVADVILRFVFRMDPRLHHLIVCRRPYPGRVANRSFWDRAGQLCTNAARRAS